MKVFDLGKKERCRVRAPTSSPRVPPPPPPKHTHALQRWPKTPPPNVSASLTPFAHHLSRWLHVTGLICNFTPSDLASPFCSASSLSSFCEQQASTSPSPPRRVRRASQPSSSSAKRSARRCPRAARSSPLQISVRCGRLLATRIRRSGRFKPKKPGSEEKRHAAPAATGVVAKNDTGDGDTLYATMYERNAHTRTCLVFPHATPCSLSSQPFSFPLQPLSNFKSKRGVC